MDLSAVDTASAEALIGRTLLLAQRAQQVIAVDNSDKMVELGSELARSDDMTRTVATAGFLKLVEVVAKQYRRTKPKAAKARALVAVTAMVGAVMMSRIVTDPELSAAILRHTKKHLLNL